jgi:hypothetical protein
MVWLSVAAAIGCGSSAQKVSLGAGCVLNTDCTNPLACKFSKCHRACNESRDCDPGQRCVKVDGIGVCQLPEEAALVCGASVACAQPLVCGPDSKCRNSCTVAADCIGTQACMPSPSSGNSVCADTTETLTPRDGGATGGTGGGAGDARNGTGGTAGTDAGGTGGMSGMDGTDGGIPEVPLVIDVSAATNPVVPGQRLMYTMTVGNVSSRAVDGVRVLLRVPTGLQFSIILDADPNPTCNSTVCPAGAEAVWTLGTITAGTTKTISVNASVLQNVGNTDSIATSVTLTATGVNPINVTKTVQVYNMPSAQLALGTAYSPVTPSQSFTLDLDVGQIGTAALAATELRLSLPAGLSAGTISDGGTQDMPGQIVWPLGSFAVGAALHRTVDVTVDPGVPPGSVLAAHATLIFDGGVAIDASTDRPISVVAAAPPLQVDVGVASSPVVPGGRLLYTITASNVSARAIDGVNLLLRTPTGVQFSVLVDADPTASCNSTLCPGNAEANWNLGTIAAGASQTITVNALVVATEVGDGSLMIAPVTVRATGVDDINVSKTVQVFGQPAAQLAFGAVVGPVTAGQSFTLDLDVGQIGTSALAGAELRVVLPEGLALGTISDGGTQPTPRNVVWSIGNFAVGATLHRTVAVTVAGTAVPGTIASAHAALTYDGGDPVDAVADYAISVAPAVMPLTMDIVATPNPVAPGARLLYTTTITNTSARAVDGVSVLFRVPFGLNFSIITNADPDPTCVSSLCSANFEALWNVGTLAVGGSQIITVDALVAATVLQGSLIPSSTKLAATGLTSPIWVHTTVPARQ